MALILCMESSGPIGSVALFEEEQLLGQIESTEERSHSKRLAPDIKELFESCGRDLKELHAVAIASGPGSYTGLRIGVSLAKGFAMALDLPLIAINTLLIMASSVKVPKGAVCPMIDARRMEVYSALFNKDLDLLVAPRPEILSGNSFRGELDRQPILFIGDGAEKASGIICHENAAFDPSVYAKAREMGAEALRKYRAKEFENIDTFEPEYLKPVYTTIPKSRV